MMWTRAEFLAGVAAGAMQGPGPAADLGTLHGEVAQLAAGHEYAYSYGDGRIASFAEFQKRGRAKILELLHYEPAETAADAQVVERVDCGAYFRERITFATTRQFRVPAYVLIPKKGKRPLPAIVDLHSHGGMFLFGKEKVVDLAPNHAAMVGYHKENYDGRPTATELVKRGYLVISIDAFAFGERRLLLDADARYGRDRAKFSVEDVRYLNRQCASKEAALMKELALAGATWPGIVFWDDMRTVSYVASRPDVDPKRIGCVGISMGGYRSLFLSALDQRIRAGCVTGFMSTVRPMMRAHIDTHSMIHFLPGLHRYLDWPDVAALAAPRALMVQQCSRDGLFPLEGMKAAVTGIGRSFDKAGYSANFTGRFYDAPHRFTLAMQDEAFSWLDQKLENS
jgi:dienelactone hydrolase